MKKKKLKIIGIIMIILGGVLLSYLLIYIPGTWLWEKYEQRGLRGDFEKESASAVQVNQNVLGKLQGAAVADKLRQLATTYKADLKSEQTIAVLEIPKIGVNVVVVEGTSESSFRKGPGHIEDTPLPGMGGNFSIAGDRVLYGGPFLNLDEVAAGDEIFLRTKYGSFSYIVNGSQLTTPEDVSVLRSLGYEAITLITCDPPWGTSKRLVVQAKLVSESLLEDSETAEAS